MRTHQWKIGGICLLIAVGASSAAMVGEHVPAHTPGTDLPIKVIGYTLFAMMLGYFAGYDDGSRTSFRP